MLLCPFNLSAGNIPTPASGMTDSLAFSQKRFAAAEVLLRTFAVNDLALQLFVRTRKFCSSFLHFSFELIPRFPKLVFALAQAILHAFASSAPGANNHR